MEKVYYISQGKTSEEHLENISNVLNAGCRLIQLRMKNCTSEEYKQTAVKALNLCTSYDVTLIINDSIEIAKSIQAHGVHLGKNDSSPTQAREILGPNAIIGGTANKLEDCIRLAEQNVDYIGLGPFQFTETKNNLSPVLGVEGFKHIISSLRSNTIQTPVFAIGGITVNDVEALLQTNIHGIALSGVLSNKEVSETETLFNQILTNINAAIVNH